MKILFLTEGGREFGFGHITRCIALSQAMKMLQPETDISFVIHCGRLPGQSLGISDDIDTTVFNWCRQKSRTYELVGRGDLVIIDSYLAEQSLYNDISQMTSGCVLMVDDYKRIDYPEGIVVSPSIYGDSLNYPDNGKTTYLSGKDYIILRKEFWNVEDKNINKDIKNMLVTLGGSKQSIDLLDDIVRYLRSHFDFNLNIIDVREGRIGAADMRNFMLDADLCISGGGQTTEELLRTGTPAIGICFADNQVLNLNRLSALGLIENAGWYNNPKFKERLHASVVKLSPYQERVSYYKAARNTIDGRGALRVMQTAMEELSKLERKVT